MSYAHVMCGLAIAAVLAVGATGAAAQLIDDTTYQGRLKVNGALPDGSFDFLFSLWTMPVGGVQIGPQVFENDLAVVNGLFTAQLAFGAGSFDSSNRYLQIEVRPGASIGAFDVLTPRQPLSAAPTAAFALSSGTTLNEAHANGNVIANNGEAAVVVEGWLDVGTSALSGRFNFNNSNAGLDSNIRMLPFNGEGASLQHLDENGALISDIEPDFGGEGIFVRFVGDGGAMTWDGDLAPGGAGSGSQLTISGPASTSRFNTSVAGNSSVRLPIDAIGPAETLAEAGVANIQSVSVVLGSTLSPILTRSITVPVDGYVLVLAQGDLAIAYNGSGGAVIWGVSMSPTSLPGNQDIQFNLPAGLPIGTYDSSASAHGLFAVTAGTNTFYFNAQTTTVANFPANMWDLNLTLLFIPTAYGTVVSNLIDPANPGGENNVGVGFAPMTAQDIEAEYQAELARVRDEMAAQFLEQQRQLEIINRRLDSALREQDLGRSVGLGGG